MLLNLGADLGYTDENGYDALIDAMFSKTGEAEKIALVQFLIQQGVRLNGRIKHGESALSISSRCGWFEMVLLLLDAGCDRSVLMWTDLMQAIALGTLSQIETLLQQGAVLTAMDSWERTPWLLSVQVGDISKAQLLLAAGANPLAVGYCGKLPLMYALDCDNLSMLSWLIEFGLDVNATDEFGETALMLAAELDRVEAATLLLAAGAIPSQAAKYDGKAIEKATSVEMVERLVAAGEDLADIEPSMRHLFTRVDLPEEWELDSSHYHADKYPRFGDRNPEEMLSPFWREMVKFRWRAYTARYHYQDKEHSSGKSRKAVWCFRRFGQSITVLPDGRVIEIAGEHEDFYDPDFCIYNDVVVYDGQGDFKIYGYPTTVFLPTDFHTATPVDSWIYIIGNLGYGRDCTIGETPVYRLNCNTFAIEKIITCGESPGWISKHRAVLRDHKIYISGGEVWASQQEQPRLINDDTSYILDLNEHCWHRSEKH